MEEFSKLVDKTDWAVQLKQETLASFAILPLAARKYEKYWDALAHMTSLWGVCLSCYAERAASPPLRQLNLQNLTTVYPKKQQLSDIKLNGDYSSTVWKTKLWLETMKWDDYLPN